MAEINSEGVHCLSGSCSRFISKKHFIMQVCSRRHVCQMLRNLVSLMFQCHPMITEEEIQKTCDVLVKVVTSYFD